MTSAFTPPKSDAGPWVELPADVPARIANTATRLTALHGATTDVTPTMFTTRLSTSSSKSHRYPYSVRSRTTRGHILIVRIAFTTAKNT